MGFPYRCPGLFGLGRSPCDGEPGPMFSCFTPSNWRYGGRVFPSPKKKKPFAARGARAFLSGGNALRGHALSRRVAPWQTPLRRRVSGNGAAVGASKVARRGGGAPPSRRLCLLAHRRTRGWQNSAANKPFKEETTLFLLDPKMAGAGVLCFERASHAGWIPARSCDSPLLWPAPGIG